MKWIKRWIKKTQPMAVTKKQWFEQAREGFSDEQWQGWMDVQWPLNIQNHAGETALMIALMEGRLKTLKSLIKAGASIGINNREGENVLIVCLTFTDFI